ncbi:MAG: diguanylate cyclase [Pseudomonadota bacterium]
MPVTGLNHYNIKAPLPLLEEVRDFYCTVLGLTQGYKPPPANSGFWLYAGDSPILHLSVDDAAAPFTNVTTVDHIAFTCVDFAAMRGKLDAMAVDYSFSQRADGGPSQIFLRDLVGNGLELNFRE